MKKKKNKKQDVKNKKTILTEQQYLTREIIMAIKNLKPSYWNWKNIIMKLKMLEMKDNVEVIKNTFDHALDMKQYRENLLLSCLNECKKQYQGNVNEHLRIIGLLESIHEYKLNTALNNYGLILNLLIEEFGVSFEKLCSLQNDDEIFIHSILFEEQHKMKITLHDTKSEMFYKLENIKRNGDDRSKIALVHLEKKVSSAWNFLTTILSNYSKDNQYRYLSYENLNKKDKKSKEIIVQQFIQITELIDFITLFQSKLIKFHSHEKISKIIFEKNLLVNDYAFMEKRFIKVELL
ncbi:dynein regulatory complex subunit 2-like isoform X2 [Microplitis mediator]|uniref:dynein regulatory complex subunit 2-like isoform X2 n=1 Tax=Microplitis mediator TaxID=375433 RepID=UPI002553C11C|nr:dynein regulatory complex subunit 2-like isoform X2 [Microplitis mediator]